MGDFFLGSRCVTEAVPSIGLEVAESGCFMQVRTHFLLRTSADIEGDPEKVFVKSKEYYHPSGSYDPSWSIFFEFLRIR